MSYETLRYEADGHVRVLTYDRPEQRNAVNRQMNRELHDVWHRFRDDDGAFVLVITGAGDAFCAGWDLQDAADLGEAGLEGIGEYGQGYDAFRTHVWNSPGDWNIVAGDGMTVRAPRRRIRAGDGDDHQRPALDASEALRIGLATEVVPEGKALERALELAQGIAELPQGAIRSDKETMVRNVGRTYEEQLRQELEATLSMFLRRDSHAIGAGAFKRGETPEWPHHGL
jgi:enoyl-CoA hydratase